MDEIQKEDGEMKQKEKRKKKAEAISSNQKSVRITEEEYLSVNGGKQKKIKTIKQ